MASSRRGGRSWGGAVLVLCLVAAGVEGTAGASSTPTTAATTTTTTTTSLPPAVAAWKAKYEPAIGQLADDALVVWDTGQRNAKHPTGKKVKATLSTCRQWLGDAQKLPGEVPPIPEAAAQKTWEALVSASLSAASACVTALTRGSKPAARKFGKALLLVHGDEARLIDELGGTASQLGETGT